MRIFFLGRGKLIFCQNIDQWDQVTEPEEYVPLISCLMTPPANVDECFSDLGITTTSPDSVNKCASSEEGSKLLHDYGVETKGLSPPLTFVPWVTYNDVFDEEIWNETLKDPKEALCKYFLQHSDKC